MTATGNDYGYEYMFERQVLGLGQEGRRVPRHLHLRQLAQRAARLDAAQGRGWCRSASPAPMAGKMREICSLLLEAPSGKTAIIQQIHIVAAHIVCALVERAMFPRNAA